MTSTATWADVETELDRWAGAGRQATLWWRDDDAREPGPALERLIGIAARFAVGPGIAVIPQHASADLVALLAGVPGCAPMQHGWAHCNHGAAGEKKVELGGERPLPAVLADLERGRERLRRLFGDALVPALVPPWNRIAAPIADALPGAGYRVLSTFGPRDPACGALRRVNTHVDLIDWRGTRAARPPGALLGDCVAHLRRRRQRVVDGAEPSGLLSHHLDHDEACWAFIEEWIARTAAHPGARWLDAREALRQ